MSRVQRSRASMIQGWMPFGLSRVKPRHFREMLRIAWENRDSLPYAWRVLTRGVCDGCALGTTGLRDWTIQGTHLCMVRLELMRLNTMGALSPELLGDADALKKRSSRQLRELGRLPCPMRRRKGEKGFQRISFDEAWAEIGPRWRAFDPARTAMFVTSRGVTNEVYYVAQKVFRYLGSNHVDNSARLCHSPSTSGLKSTIGVAATTCSYSDWFDADLIVFLGSNPANDQPVTTKYLYEARRRGTRVLSVNAYREPGLEAYWIPSNVDSALFGTRLCDRTFLVRVGGDLAFLNAVQRILIAKNKVARDFIRAATHGYEDLVRALDAQPMDVLLAACGLPLAEVEAFASEIAAADRGILVWSMGITQHTQGADTVRAIANLALLREWVGRPGTGLMPIRGHSGVQGGAEMGCYATALPGGVPIDADSARRFANLWGFEVPATPGLTTVDALEAAGRGELDAFYCIGGNLLETLPEPHRVESALAKIPLRIHSDIVVTSQMLAEPAETVILLPARTRYEQRGGGTETTTERRVVFSPYVPGHDVGETQSEWEMLLEFARAVKPEGAGRIHFEDGAAIRAEIEAAVPAYRGIAALAKQGDQFQWGGPLLCTDRKFPTADGKAHFQCVEPHALARETARASNRFKLATRRGKQFNSMVQCDVDQLTGAARDHILIDPADAARLGLAQDDPIVLTGPVGTF
ncbi:MAG TPA: molybdopterin-dependent oxidoreductase, partial [Planctomycetota bacterium]|nr:molybdopterin-dependent oxidoreductase [Planctomycetota bacterium]